MKTIDLANNQLEKIESDAFSSYPQLQTVNLTGNNIGSLGNNLGLLDNPHTEIDLSHNKIAYIQGKRIIFLSIFLFMIIFRKRIPAIPRSQKKQWSAADDWQSS